VNRCSRLAAGAIALSAFALNGCVTPLMAVQAVPAVMTATSMATTAHQSPFVERAPSGPTSTDPQTVASNAQLRRAQCGDAQAQFQVASALSNDGSSIPNRVEIYKWYRLAELGNYEPASNELDGLLVAMTPSKVAEGQARVRGWQPSTEGCQSTG